MKTLCINNFILLSSLPNAKCEFDPDRNSWLAHQQTSEYFEEPFMLVILQGKMCVSLLTAVCRDLHGTMQQLFS